MTLWARYTIVVDRTLGENDYHRDEVGESGHDGTGFAAAEQLAGELQEAWACGGVAGFFQVTRRTILSTAEKDDPLVPAYADDPPIEGLILEAVGPTRFAPAHVLCEGTLDNPEYVRGVAEFLIDTSPGLNQDDHKQTLMRMLAEGVE